jgi:aspartate-semialdehyde dehydrogenase
MFSQKVESMKKVNVGIVGITGLVGQTLLEILEQSSLPVDTLYVYASSRSKGKEVAFKGQTIIIKELNEDSFNDPLDIVFFAIESDLALKYAKIASSKKIYVVDNSSAHRMIEHIPLVVPEVNSHVLKSSDYIVANPNCSTIQSVVALHTVHQLFNLVDVDYSTYQAVSGSGVNGIEDLERTSQGLEPNFYPKTIYNNVIPQIDQFLENGYTKEEMKMILETQKILASKINITATTVRVPVKVGHSVQIKATTKENIDLDKLKNAYGKIDEVKLYPSNDYPTPLDASGSNLVHIGRIRTDLNYPNKVLLWTVADNVRKGAALNAVQIGEYIYKEFIK